MLTAIDIENFRCIEQAHVEFHPAATGIVGANGSGKTSLLEAVYFLAHGRSFRTLRREKLLKSDTAFFRVVARLDSLRGPLIGGVEYAQGQSRANLGGLGVTGVADIAEVLPVQVIDPSAHRVIEEGSSRRRRLMDWGVFHVKHDFLGTWRRYQRALQQRNAALKAQHTLDLLGVWEAELCSAGEAVDRARADYVVQLQPHFEELVSRLLGDGNTRLSYRRGWAQDLDLAQALRDARIRDLRLRTTTVGPHRADLLFVRGALAARDVVSRGQQKMLASAFVLAQLALRVMQGAPHATLMLDDPAAELDVDNLGKLLAAIAVIPCQLVVTSVQEQGLKGIDLGKVFHVKQGRFSSVL